jgi:hypothetical protein
MNVIDYSALEWGTRFLIRSAPIDIGEYHAKLPRTADRRL